MAAATPTTHSTMRKVVWKKYTTAHAMLFIAAIQVCCIRGVSTLITYNVDTQQVESTQVDASVLSSRSWLSTPLDDLIVVPG